MKETQKETRVVFLRGFKTILRPICKDDLPNMIRWMNDPEIRRFIHLQTPMTIESEIQWLEGLSKRPQDLILAIETIEGKHIGTIGLHGIDPINRIATTGTVIGEKKFRGKGYGTDAKLTLLKYAFDTLNLRKICSRALAFNERSIRYSQRCGYKIEGRLKKQIFRDGKYCDEILLAVFRSNFEKAHATYSQKMDELYKQKS